MSEKNTNDSKVTKLAPLNKKADVDEAIEHDSSPENFVRYEKLDPDSEEFRDDANDKLGQMKVLTASKKFFEYNEIRALKEFKDKKLYLGVSYRDQNGNFRRCTNFKEFSDNRGPIKYSTAMDLIKQTGTFDEGLYSKMIECGVTFHQRRVMARELSNDQIKDLRDRVRNADGDEERYRVFDEMALEMERMKKDLEEEKKNSYRLGKALDRKELEEKIEKDKAAQRQAPPWPELVLKIREEASAAAMLAVGNLDDIERLMSELAAGGDDFASSKNGKADYDAAASSIGLNLSMILSRVSQVVSLAHSMGLSDYLDDQEDFSATLLTDTEAENVRTRWQAMLKDANEARMQRENARNSKISRGRRGRPKGAKNKPKKTEGK